VQLGLLKPEPGDLIIRNHKKSGTEEFDCYIGWTLAIEEITEEKITTYVLSHGNNPLKEPADLDEREHVYFLESWESIAMYFDVHVIPVLEQPADVLIDPEDWVTLTYLRARYPPTVIEHATRRVIEGLREYEAQTGRPIAFLDSVGTVQ